MTFWKRRNDVLCFIIFYRRFLLSNVSPNLYLFELEGTVKKKKRISEGELKFFLQVLTFSTGLKMWLFSTPCKKAWQIILESASMARTVCVEIVVVFWSNMQIFCKHSHISECLVLQNLKRVHFKHNTRYVEREDNRTKQQGYSRIRLDSRIPPHLLAFE